MSENVQIGTRELGAISNEEDDNPEEVIGFLMFSTTGELFVERDWLIDAWEQSELPSRLLPTETTRWQAYRRAINYIQEQTEYVKYSVENEHYGREFDCEMEIKKSNSLGSNVFLIYARTFLPEEVCGEDGGNWTEQRVGKIDFYRPEDGDSPGAMLTEIEIEKDNAHYNQVERVANLARETEKEMRSCHNFNDLQNILEGFRNRTEAVEIRRSAYFIPAPHQEEIDSLMEVWQGMNQFKNGGEEIRIDKTPVVNMGEQRELVASRVRSKMESMVDEIVGEVVSEFEESAETTADEAANEIMDELGETETASTYNQLLGMRLSIKEILEERRSEMADESEEIIENILNQKTFDEVEE